MYNCLNTNGCVVSHVGPVATGPKGMKVARFLQNAMKNAGFLNDSILGFVGIPSFRGEWGYVLNVKTFDVKND